MIRLYFFGFCLFLSVQTCLGQENPLNIPQVITPNGDGINDIFIIDSLIHFASNELLIFNRNETEVFRAQNYQNNWQGEFNQTSEALPPGTYFYVLQATTFAKSQLFYKGLITIIR